MQVEEEAAVIKSFANEVTEDIFHGVHTHGIRKQLHFLFVKDAERKLDLLNCADTLEDLKAIPSLHNEAVRDCHGKFSIPLQGDWRLTFRWNDGPEDVELKK